MSEQGTNELVDKLVGDMPRVYLPAVSRDVTTPGQSEAVANRPHVSAAAEAYFSDPDRLYGDRVSEVTLINEQPIHRLMVYLHAQGASRGDIAKQTGYTPQMVGTVLRQPWARQRLVQILNECGKDQVRHFLQHEISPSLEVLREVRDNVDAKPSERVTAANAILDRALGKPTVMIESKNTNTTVPADVTRIDQEIAAVRKQLEGKGFTSDGN